jgi:uncharacterized protein
LREMRALLDINVLIALMDPDHAFHERAHVWWALRSQAWASCPLTENGVIRIMSSSAYSAGAQFTVADMAARLVQFTEQTDHQFWVDSLSFREGRHFEHQRILSSRHLTDLYLLALAVEREGRLVTFDRHVPLGAVRSAQDRHLEVI